MQPTHTEYEIAFDHAHGPGVVRRVTPDAVREFIREAKGSGNFEVTRVEHYPVTHDFIDPATGSLREDT